MTAVFWKSLPNLFPNNIILGEVNIYIIVLVEFHPGSLFEADIFVSNPSSLLHNTIPAV